MTDKEDILKENLLKHFGHLNFKSSLQYQAVECVLEGKRDVFVSMPTGSGKSLCYQLPALMSNGITLVLSPLIALIDDQVTQLQTKGLPAAALNSKTLATERKRILSDLKAKEPTIKLLYITPEMAATKGFRDILTKLNTHRKVGHIAIDEAHCVSEWGHDFRPDYLKLSELRDLFPSVPMLALTATATPHVQQDIVNALKMREPVALFKSSCFRSNLFYDISFKETLKDPQKDLRNFITHALTSSCKKQGCGIVYCRTREGCQELAGRLSSKGIKARPYHAGLKADERASIQHQWMKGEVPVIVATISFGMGVDKANVRFVAHWTLPKGIEAYYQESGRAGRDGELAYCRLYYSRFDRDQLLFLLKKELSEKPRKGKFQYSGRAAGNKATEKSFETLVKYCEEVKCRHAVIAQYFGDAKPECDRSCDCCKNPASVKEALKAHQLCQSVNNKKAVRGSSLAYFEDGQPDMSVYEGGRWGQVDEDNDDSEDSDPETSSIAVSKKKTLDFFEEEFRKRRRKDSTTRSDLETPSIDCKLKHPSFTTRVPRLTIKVREHCYNLLLKALQENSPSSVITMETKAACLEYDIVSVVKTPEVYKLQVHKKVSEIKQATKIGEVYTCINGDMTDQNDEIKDKLPGFVSAISLIKPPRVALSLSTAGPSATSDVIQKLGGFQSASQLFSSYPDVTSFVSLTKATSTSSPITSSVSLTTATSSSSPITSSVSLKSSSLAVSSVNLQSDSISLTNRTRLSSETGNNRLIPKLSDGSLNPIPFIDSLRPKLIEKSDVRERDLTLNRKRSHDYNQLMEETKKMKKDSSVVKITQFFQKSSEDDHSLFSKQSTTHIITTSSYSRDHSYSTSSRTSNVNTSSQTSNVGTSSRPSSVITSSQTSNVGTSSRLSSVITSSQTSNVGTSSRTNNVGTSSWTSSVNTSSQTSNVGTSSRPSSVITSSQTSNVGTSSRPSSVITSSQTSNVGTSSRLSSVNTSSQTSNVGTSSRTSNVGTSSRTSSVGTSSRTSDVGTSSRTSNVGTSSRTSSVGTSSRTSSSQKAQTAGVIVKILTPYYHKGKFASKDLFKRFAKILTDHLSTEHKTSTEVERWSHQIINEYFTKVSKCSHEKDLMKLRQLVTEIVH